MIGSYVRLSLAALLPVAASVLLYLLGKNSKIERMHKALKQTFCGIIFGLIAVYGTEGGIPFNGSTINCRDAAPLCAGLFFGGYSGILAGLIGGIERWFAVYWGAGYYSRLACSVATIISGVYAALLRKYVFTEKRPAWHFSLATGVVMETFHLSLLYVTNLADVSRTSQIIQVCAVTMIPANGLSVMAASIALRFASGENKVKTNSTPRLSTVVQRGLLICVVICYFLSTIFTVRLHTGIADNQTTATLRQSISDVEDMIKETADDYLLSITHTVAGETQMRDPAQMLQVYGVSEINYIGKDGIIYQSSNAQNIGYDMASKEKSAEFLCLLDNETEYVQELGTITRDTTEELKYAGVATKDGFIQVAFDREQVAESMSGILITTAHNRHVGETGYILVLDEEGTLYSVTKGVDSVEFIQPAMLAEEETDKLFQCTINEEELMCMYEEYEGYMILAVLPRSEAYQTANISLYALSFLQTMIYAVLFILIYLQLRHGVVKALDGVNGTLDRIVQGDLNVSVEERNTAEFSQLSDHINTTVDAMKGYIADAKARIEQELEVARNIQLSALPRTFPAYPNRKDMDIYALTQPAKEVGGDFYDYYFTNNGHFHFLVADVSGKGIPAAMFMMRSKAHLKGIAETGTTIDDVFTKGNIAICEGNDADMFVTSWMTDLDMESGLLEFANAGHNPPLLKHKDGKFEFVRSKAGLVLGGMSGIRYRKQQLQLEPGDILVLYTDGVTEATNSNNELYGDDRLHAFLNAREYPNVQSLSEALRRDVMAFTGDADQFDDITILAFEYFGPEKGKEIHFEEAEIKDITEVTEFLEAELEKMDCPMKAMAQLSIAVDEVYSNIVKFAYGAKKGPITVKLQASTDPKGVELTFTDEGIPYNPMKKEDPDTTLSAEERQIGGLGVFMVKKSMDNMTYEYVNDKNILHLFKKF